MDVGEALGRAVGGLLAPLVAEASLTRGVAVLHADGVVLHGKVEALEADAPLGALGKALQGPALVRFSSALQRYREGRDPPDVFGAAIRFGAGTPEAQDLLFGTFRHLWEIPLAPLRTDPHDFLANDFYTALPSHVPGTETLFTFRLIPNAAAPDGKDHRDRLERAVAEGRAKLRLEARLNAGGRYVPVASIELTSSASLAPEEELHWNPFRAGAGLVPAGFFQAMRAAVYPASQLGSSLARGPR
jgi:hypothetical protein